MIFGNESEMNSELIAKSVNTNPVVIRRLLSILREKGFVKSKLGPNGGSSLLKDPEDIRLSHIYGAVETGNLYHLHYQCPSQVCPVGANISGILSTILQDAEEAFKMVLGKKTLYDILENVKEKTKSIQGRTKEELIAEFNKSVGLILSESNMTN
jgi:DNA-binding IscR family transcriptional regulator